MKTKYPIEIIDLRHQPDYITPKKIQLFHEYGTDPDNARLFLILVRRREIELISDGNILIEVKVIYILNNIITRISVFISKYKYVYNCMYSCLINMKSLNFKDFMKKYNLKNDTMNETELQRVYNYPIYPRDSKIYSDKGFINIDNASMGVAIGSVL